MSSSFGILFSIRIQHSYYTGRCMDFDFLVTPATAALLRNRRIITRTDQGSFYALCEKDEAGVPLVDIQGISLRFGLRLNNPFFSNFTRMDFQPGSTVLYRNLINPLSLDTGLETQLVSNLFTHPISKTNRPLLVSVKDSSDNPVQDPFDSTVFDGLSVPVDLRKAEPGLFTVTEKYSGSTKKFSYYLEPELLRLQCFGIFEINTSGSFYTLPAPPEFLINFTAKSEILKYYLVGHNYSNAELLSLSVADAGYTEDLRPQVVFTKISQGAFTASDISPSLLTDTQSKVILFKSAGSIPRLEKPRHKIQLSKNTDLIIKHLPLPGIDKSTSDIIIQISKP